MRRTDIINGVCVWEEITAGCVDEEYGTSSQYRHVVDIDADQIRTPNRRYRRHGEVWRAVGYPEE